MEATGAPDIVDPRDIPWWRRARSAVLLATLSATLGLVTAAILAVVVVGTISLIDTALG